jgi:hypothetical protein
VPAGRGGSFSKNHSPTLQASPQLLKLEKSKKKHPLRFSRNILEPKEVTFENRNKTICFLSVFSVLIYIFGKTINTKN